MLVCVRPGQNLKQVFFGQDTSTLRGCFIEYHVNKGTLYIIMYINCCSNFLSFFPRITDFYINYANNLVQRDQKNINLRRVTNLLIIENI